MRCLLIKNKLQGTKSKKEISLFAICYLFFYYKTKTTLSSHIRFQFFRTLCGSGWSSSISLSLRTTCPYFLLGILSRIDNVLPIIIASARAPNSIPIFFIRNRMYVRMAASESAGVLSTLDEIVFFMDSSYE